MELVAKQLVIGGKTLRCIERMPVGMIFDLAEAMEGGEQTMQAVAAMSKMIKQLVVKEDQGQLAEALHSFDNPVGFDELNTALGNLMVQYSGRPLGRPSRLSRGPAPTGGTSKVVSLSRATVSRPASSSTDGTSAAS